MKTKLIAEVAAASEWMLKSGIQSKAANSKHRGGVASWYELESKTYPFLYSEITGYALSAWMFLDRVEGGKKNLSAAKQAMKWLEKNAITPEGGVKTRMYLVRGYESPNYSFHQGRIYAFDTGMVGYGMVQLQKQLKSKKLLALIERVAGFMLDTMTKKDGTLYPYYDPETKRCGEDDGKWSDQSGSFHAKCAMFYIDLWKLTKNKKYHMAATRLLDRISQWQEPSGRFITRHGDRSTHLHPHAYTLEGLLYGYLHLGKKAYLKHAMRGFEWMLEGVSSDGSVSSIYIPREFSHHERSDIVAQLLRIGSILYGIQPKAVTPMLSTLARVREHLVMFQYREKTKQKGGFLYGAATDGMPRGHLNAWGTMFSLQSLWMYDQFIRKKKPVTMDAFV